MGDRLEARWLPDGRFLLTLGKCLPVVISSATYFSKTESELFCLVGKLTLIACMFREKYGYELPMATGRYTEEESGRFVLADPETTGKYCRVFVPASWVGRDWYW